MRFNPVLGFLSAATSSLLVARPATDAFQSRSGFSLRCDDRALWRFCVHTRVSIPFWVFSPLRLSSSSKRGSVNRFQSRSGFSLRCDSWIMTLSLIRHHVSIPFWVFSPLRHEIIEQINVADGFQSRSGFSLRCDTLLTMSPDSAENCFNPVLGFLSAATRRGTDSALNQQPCFNPVLGFLSAATQSNPDPRSGSIRFQSRSGFSLRCDKSKRERGSP